MIGTDLVEIDRLAKQVEQVLRTVPGTSSAYAERGIGGYYLDIVADRAALARYGIMIQDVQATASVQTVTTTVEGRQRFDVNMRYPRDLRSDPASIARCPIRRPAGRCRWGKSQKSRRRAGRPRSGPRTASSRSTSMSISGIATSAVMSPMRKVPSKHPVSAGCLPDVEYEYMSERGAARRKWSCQ